MAFLFEFVAVGLEDAHDEVLDGRENHEHAGTNNIDPHQRLLFAWARNPVRSTDFIQAHSIANMAGYGVELDDEDKDGKPDEDKDEGAELPDIVYGGDRAILFPNEESEHWRALNQRAHDSERLHRGNSADQTKALKYRNGDDAAH